MAAKKKTAKAKAAPRAKKAAASKMLSKSKSDRMISGVIGGLAAYFDIDSTILRLLWIAIVAFTGFVPGIMAYVLAMLVIPEAN